MAKLRKDKVFLETLAVSTLSKHRSNSMQWVGGFFALTLIVWVVVVAINAGASTLPIPEEQQNARQAQQRLPTREASPSDSIPSLEKLLQQSSQAESGSQQAHAKQSWWRKPEWIVVVVTGIYALFAGLQWWAIRRQADNMVSLESPKVLVTKLRLDGDEITGSPSVRVGFTNHGRTPAAIVTICVEGKVIPINQPITYQDGVPQFPSLGRHERLPDYPTYVDFWPAPVDPIIQPNTQYTNTFPCGTTLTEDQVRSVKEGESLFWVYGFIGFIDSLNITRETGFCCLWSEGSASHPFRRFVQYGPPTYFYHNRPVRKKRTSPPHVPYPP